jgi:hypothetical protein
MGIRFTKAVIVLFVRKCEVERKPKENFLSLLVAPARKALDNKATL